jgi:aconitate hydratase
VHLERHGKPGLTLLGSDSHTPTGGGLGMLAIGAGGLDVAVAMGGGPYYLMMPKVCKVNLVGKLSPWVTAKDIILEVLRQMTVKGGVGKVMEYAGDAFPPFLYPKEQLLLIWVPNWERPHRSSPAIKSPKNSLKLKIVKKIAGIASR